MRSRILGVPCAAIFAATLNVVPAPFDPQPAGAATPLGNCVVLPGDMAVGMASTANAGGYWIATAQGYIYACYGNSVNYGSMAAKHLNAPIVGIASTPDGKGYWLVAADGGVFAFGDAVFSGSDVGNIYSRVSAISAFADNQHYLLSTIDGGVTVFGFTGGSWPPGWKGTFGFPPNAPMVAAANWGTATSPGYWTAGSDGVVFAFGYAPFYGSMGGQYLNAPVVGLTATPDHGGYWFLGSDGGVFAFGDGPFLGSAVG